jgi:hypothetical protein
LPFGGLDPGIVSRESFQASTFSHHSHLSSTKPVASWPLQEVALFLESLLFFQKTRCGQEKIAVKSLQGEKTGTLLKKYCELKYKLATPRPLERRGPKP